MDLPDQAALALGFRRYTPGQEHNREHQYGGPLSYHKNSLLVLFNLDLLDLLHPFYGQNGILAVGIVRDEFLKIRNTLVYHPSFGYFAWEYNLDMISIEEEGKEPTASDVASLIEYAKEHKIKVIFASPQFNPQSARVIADEVGGRVVFIDPLARDYIANLRRILGEMVQPDIVRNSQRLKEIGKAFFNLKVTWPFKDSDKKRFGKYFFEGWEYRLDKIDYEAIGTQPSKHNDIFLSFSSHFSCVNELREAEKWVEKSIIEFCDEYSYVRKYF